MSVVSLINSGDKFNSWKFIQKVERENNKLYGLFECDCGKQKEVYIPNVKNGKSKSCGCLMKKENSQRFRKDFDIGDVCGFLTIIGESIKPDGKKNRHTPCRCICGKEIFADNLKLRSGRKDNCGCKSADKFRSKKNIKITPGEKYNRLTILKEVEPIMKANGHRKRQLECQCDCGTVKILEMREVLYGSTQSCGCLKIDNAYKTHGMSKTSIYDIWNGIKLRCFNPNNNAYRYYGERGVTMCDRWKDSFENFLEDMGERPGEEYSIDRINMDGDYEPDNCRWATRIEQARNKSNNRMVKYAGKTKTFAEWVEMFGANYKSLWTTCDRVNWEVEEIFDKLIGF